MAGTELEFKRLHLQPPATDDEKDGDKKQQHQDKLKILIKIKKKPAATG